MKYRYFTEKLSNGDKIKLRVSDVICSGNSYGEMREVICVKCGEQKTSYSYIKKENSECTLCKGSGICGCTIANTLVDNPNNLKTSI